VRVWFEQGIEPAFSSVRVLDTGGNQVDHKDIAAEVVDKSGKPIDAKSAKAQTGDPRALRVSLPTLAPGRYRVLWRVLAKDGHVTEGEFAFRVAP
jgi:methionine-rich copper-binding protein CopC